MVVVLLALVLLSAAVMPAGAGELTAETGGITIELNRRPDPPRVGDKTLYTARLREAGKPVTGARVMLTGRMTDGMTVLAPLRSDTEAGVYRGEILFTMDGPWELRLRIVTRGRRSEILMKEQVLR